MRNLDSNELQHVYGGGKSCGNKSRSHGKSNSNCHKSRSHKSRSHGKSNSRRKGSGHCRRG